MHKSRIIISVIYIITLCNFWHRSSPGPNTQHIQKLATEELRFLRYCRSRVFTFVFFMLKLKGISSGQNNKSCSIIHKGSNKIDLAFFWFFCDFLRNLQESANLFTYWSYLFAIKTLERFWGLQCGWCGSWPGKGRGRVLGGLGLGLGAWTGWRWPAVGCSAGAGTVRLFPARPAPDRGRARQGQLQGG
jgi:hypothetical protein